MEAETQLDSLWDPSDTAHHRQGADAGWGLEGPHSESPKVSPGGLAGGRGHQHPSSASWAPTVRQALE